MYKYTQNANILHVYKKHTCKTILTNKPGSKDSSNLVDVPICSFGFEIWDLLYALNKLEPFYDFKEITTALQLYNQKTTKIWKTKVKKNNKNIQRHWF